MQSCLAWLSLSCNNLFLFFVVFYYACNVYYSWCVFISWNTLGKRNRGSGRVWSHPRPDPIKHTPQPHGWLTRPKCCWNFWVGFLYLFIFFGRWVFCYFWVIFYNIVIDTKSASHLETWPNFNIYDTIITCQILFNFKFNF